MKRLFVKEIAVLLVLALLIPMFSVAEDVQVNLPGGVPEATDSLEVDDLMEVDLEDEATGDDLLLDGLSDALTIDELQETPSELDGESDAEAETEENAAKKYGVPTQLTLGVKEAFALKCTKKDLTYKSSAPKIAKVSKKGVITPLKKGKATIAVYSKKKKLTTCKVTVVAAPKKVTLDMKSVTLEEGQTLILKATLPKKTASNKLVWTTSNKNVARVDANGTVTAVKAGTANITVKTFNKKKAVCKVTVTASTQAPTPTSEPTTPSEGIVIFGHYDQDNNPSNGKEPIEWIELARNGDTVTMISKYALDTKPYNTVEESVTWETCTLRSWLNSTFLNTAFTSEEQARIQTVRVTAEDNPYWGTEAGSDTYDKVWLLSIREAENLFSSNAARVCYATATAVANGCWIDDDGSCWWWLRSPGYHSYCAAHVYYDGEVSSYGDSVNYDGEAAVRPVVCLRLS